MQTFNNNSIQTLNDVDLTGQACFCIVILLLLNSYDSGEDKHMLEVVPALKIPIPALSSLEYTRVS